MKILVAGDSWGVGEWTNGQRTHLGLEQYLRDAGHDVVNVSRGGWSNLSVLKALEQGLKTNNIDCVIWLQTDPMRELLTSEEEIPRNTVMPFSKEFTLFKGHLRIPLEPGVTELTQGETINNTRDQLYYRVTTNHTVGERLSADCLVSVPYRRFSDSDTSKTNVRTESLNIKEKIDISISTNKLSDLTTAARIISRNLEFLNQAYQYANNLGVRIYCIGGLSKLKLDLIKDYPNLVPAIPSVLEMIYPEYQHADIVSANSNWRQEVMSAVKLDRESVDYFYNQYIQEQTMMDKCQEYFWPDGTHPNRKGHYRIYQKLQEIIPGI